MRVSIVIPAASFFAALAADGRLAALDRVCPASCEEYEAPRDKIAAYKKGRRG